MPYSIWEDLNQTQVSFENVLCYGGKVNRCYLIITELLHLNNSADLKFIFFIITFNLPEWGTIGDS